MPSLIPGFDYDIFISYRQNDNRSGWVTEFVKHLNEELAGTFKEPVSVYFDANPHDGLLETHDVDDSLRGKLKSLIFIPIISQTYCDPKSFAWTHEFLPFKKLGAEGATGLKIKLANGNVASRVLPISIHELDAADKQLLEAELGGVLRSIEFIYRSAGVVRPLKAQEEDVKANLNHTFYRDQINKVSRAIKELITAMQNPGGAAILPSRQQEYVPVRAKKKLALAATLVILLGAIGYGIFYFTGAVSNIFAERTKSIAVLPFENLNKDSTQDYFSSGIAEDILNHLVKISDLEVKSRTSTLQYKGTTKTAPTIGEELGVSNIVEGSVRRVGDQVRVVVQLIDTENDIHLWSETYDRDFKDVLALQSEIAIEIASALETRLTSAEKAEINKEVTTDMSAYDFYLRARDKLDKGAYTKEEFQASIGLINKAIALDPTFSNAYALKADLWYQLSTFGLPQNVWEDSARLNVAKSIEMDSLNSAGYVVASLYERFLGNLDEAKRDVEIAYRLNPKDMAVQREYGFELLSEGHERGADMVIKSIERNYSTKQPEYYQSYVWPMVFMSDYDGAEKALQSIRHLSPNADYYYYPLSIVKQLKGDFRGAIRVSEEALKLNPLSQGALDNVAWSHFRLGEYKKAAEYWSRYKEVEATFDDKGQTVPFRHRLAMCYLELGDSIKARKLILEDKEIQSQMLNKVRSTGAWGTKGGIHYDLAVDMALLGFEDEAIQNLDSAYKYGFRRQILLFEHDPAFEKIKSLPGFKALQKKVDDNAAFNKMAFTNAFNRAEASKELKGFIEK